MESLQRRAGQCPQHICSLGIDREDFFAHINIMAKKRSKARVAKRASSQDIFKEHPNMKMLLVLLVLSILVLLYLKQLA